MVKVLHFADLHIGVENYGRLDAATGLHTRLLDFLRSFDELVAYAFKEQVDLVLFAGDAYKNRDPNPTHQREFAKRIRQLAAADIPVFLLTGNHDIPNIAGRANTLDIFPTLEVPNVYVARKLATYRIQTRSGPLQIVALPWLVRSHLLSRDEYKNRTLAEIDELTLATIEKLLQVEIASLDPHIPTILAVHGSVQGAVYSSERSVMLGQEIILPRNLLTNPAFDYVALGHIHRHQELASNPPVVYSGSLDRIDFGEEKEEKGFVVAEVERGHACYQFVKLASTRPFVTIEVQADGADPMAQVREAIAQHELQEAIVRLIIHTTAEKNHFLDDNEIHKLLDQAFKIATIVRDVRRESRLRLGPNQNVEQMTPLEVLRVYLQARQVEKQRMERLLEYARRLMSDV
ncbi:MAG: exonuclease SbcCD subunit D [Chloroflexi bacterium]|nr:exonuclease SbcCD subunit D [Chloroflexota bacterium]